MLTEVTFEAFRAFKKVTIPLKPLTVFVGPNGSGKTSVLSGIHYLLQTTTRRPLSAILAGRWSASYIRSRRSNDPMTIRAAFRDGSTLSICVGPEVEGASYWASTLVAELSFTSPDGVRHAWPGTAEHANDVVRRHVGVYGRAVFARLTPQVLAEPSYSDEERPRLSPDGTGLASVIADLLSRAPERVDAILKSLQQVVPSVRKIRVARAKVTNSFTDHLSVNGEQIPVQRRQDFWGHRVVLDTASGDDIPLDACSEGTVLALGIMTVLHGEDAPRTLLIDEIDRSLHPKAQLDLVAVLRAAQEADSNLQILATGHSPFLLNALDYDEVRVTTLDDDGFALCASLADHPDLAEWKDSLKPGDWWSSELEDWVKEQAKR